MLQPLVIAHSFFPPDAVSNEQAVFLDDRRIHLGTTIFTFDHVLVPMSLRSAFQESPIALWMAAIFSSGKDAAIVYYGEDAAGKDIGEFLFQCGKAISNETTEIQVSAYGFYKDRRVLLRIPRVAAKSPGGIAELLQPALSHHHRLSRRARGRAHAVFRFEAVGTLTVYIVDGLPNPLRLPDRQYRFTTRLDDAMTVIDRPELPQRIWSSIHRDLGEVPVCVVLHCPISSERRYSLADSLLFGDELLKAFKTL